MVEEVGTCSIQAQSGEAVGGRTAGEGGRIVVPGTCPWGLTQKRRETCMSYTDEVPPVLVEM